MGVGIGYWDKSKSTRSENFSLFFSDLCCFIITKNVLNEVKRLASELQKQKRDQNIYEAYNKVTEAIKGLKTLRETINTILSWWNCEVLELAESSGVSESVSRKTHIQWNRSNAPSQLEKEHYKWVVAMSVLDSFINQSKERFQGERKQSCACVSSQSEHSTANT